jgi:Tfp pilus assembly protein FimV
MRAGDDARAEQLLAQVIELEPGSRLAAAATYDLARLAFERRDDDRARALVDRVLASPADPNLHPAARRLRSKLSP